MLRSLIAGLALFVVLTFPDQLPGSLGVGPTLAKPLGVVIVISWLFAIVGDRQRVIPFLPRDSPVLTSHCSRSWSGRSRPRSGRWIEA